MEFKPVQKKKIDKWYDDRLGHWGQKLIYLGDQDSLKAVISDFVELLNQSELTNKKQKALEQVILNLFYINSKTKGKGCLAHLTANRDSTSKGSVAEYVYGCTGSLLREVVRLIEGEGNLIAYKKGYKSEGGAAGSAGKLKLCKKGIELIGSRLVVEEIYAMTPPIQYKEKGVRRIPSREILDKAGASVVRNYNDLMKKASVSICGIQLLPPEKTVSRLFFDDKCKTGGRLYGALYQRIPKALRKLVDIDGEPTIEVDIKSTHPLIAYALEGLDITEEKAPFKSVGNSYEGDPYQIGMTHSLTKSERSVIKSLFSIMLNVSSEKPLGAKFSSKVKGAYYTDLNSKDHDDAYEQAETVYRFNFERYLKSEGSEGGEDLDLEYIIQSIMKRHRRIAHRFGNGSWEVLDKYESDILLFVMKRFCDKNIPHLVIHDSIRIAEKHSSELETVYRDAIERVLKVEFSCKDKLVSIDKERPSPPAYECVKEELDRARNSDFKRPVFTV